MSALRTLQIITGHFTISRMSGLPAYPLKGSITEAGDSILSAKRAAAGERLAFFMERLTLYE